MSAEAFARSGGNRRPRRTRPARAPSGDAEGHSFGDNCAGLHDGGILGMSGCAWPRQNYDQRLRWCSVEAKGNHAAATVYLDKLAEELTNRGLEAWLMAPPGRVPSVYITNPGARALEENVYANQGKDGLWWFWWSWAERVSMADDVDSAASAITRVLSPHRSNN